MCIWFKKQDDKEYSISAWLDYFLSLEVTEDALIRLGKWVWQLQSYSYAKYMRIYIAGLESSEYTPGLSVP